MMLANCRWRCCSVRPICSGREKYQADKKEARMPPVAEQTGHLNVVRAENTTHAHKRSTVTCPSNAPGRAHTVASVQVATGTNRALAERPCTLAIIQEEVPFLGFTIHRFRSTFFLLPRQQLGEIEV